MGHIIGYIVASFFATIISGFVLLGIPCGIILEMKGLGTYMYAITIMLAALFQLLWFIFFIFIEGSFKFNIKDIPKMIKSIFKKEKTETKKRDPRRHRTNRDQRIYIVEGLILIAIAVYSVINPQHSMVSNFIYNGTFIKILGGIFLPLIIINLINQIILEGNGFFSAVGTEFAGVLGSLVFGFIISTGMLFVASVWYPDIESTIKKSWFVYDNPNFDSIRGENFDETEYLKNEYKVLDEKYKESSDCDYNEESCMNEIKLKIVREVDNRNATIRNYGYSYKSKVKIDAYTDALCITDRKTLYNLFYKINYKDFAFEEITIDEYNDYARNENK